MRETTQPVRSQQGCFSRCFIVKQGSRVHHGPSASCSVCHLAVKISWERRPLAAWQTCRSGRCDAPRSGWCRAPRSGTDSSPPTSCSPAISSAFGGCTPETWGGSRLVKQQQDSDVRQEVCLLCYKRMKDINSVDHQATSVCLHSAWTEQHWFPGLDWLNRHLIIQIPT